jgi:hypothetical protein
MANANIEGNYQVGILAATMNNTIVRNVHVQGIIHSNAALSLAGGIAGRFYGTGGTMSFSSADIDITGYEYVAGLAGSVTGGATIEKSYATGTITTFTTGSGSENGGLVGELDSSTIRNSYADVDITAAGNIVGGLVGTNQGSSSISESYSAGAVSSLGVTSIGGLVGQTINTATVTDSYWDTDTSGQTTSDGGTGKTTVEMQQQSIFVDWDFRYIWDIATGEYPTLEAYHEPISSPSAHSAGGRSRAVIMKLRDGVIRVSEKAPTSIFSRSLRLGSHGNDVKKLQEFLNTHGFFVATSGKGSVGNETDIFGPKTQQALIKFQLNHNINPARGFFGPITQGIMAGIL